MDEPSATIGHSELLALETSVLQTLCLTINSTGSELKYKILDTLSDEDFYFPVNRAIFAALQSMERKGDYVIYTSLEEALREASVDVPEDFFIEDLFRGELPTLTELAERIGRIKERAARGIRPVSDGAPRPAAASSPSSRAAPAPSAPPATAKRPPPSSPAAPPKASSSPDVRARTPPPSRTASASSTPDARPRTVARASAAKSSPAVARTDAKALLSSEADEWDRYLEELAARQGKSFDTGFAGLDERAGGLGPGLVLLVDEDGDRRRAFLKQLTDQVAEHSALPCLYVSFEEKKASLRVRTLARLSGVPAADIEKGRLKKDSAEWKRIEESGRAAAAWLKRVYVVEADAQLGTGLVRDMCQRLVQESGQATCLLVVDTIEGFGRGSESLRAHVADLKELADGLDVLVVAGTGSTALLSDRSAHLTAVLRPGEAAPVELELLPAGATRSTVIAFDFDRSTARFAERSA